MIIHLFFAFVFSSDIIYISDLTHKLYERNYMSSVLVIVDAPKAAVTPWDASKLKQIESLTSEVNFVVVVRNQADAGNVEIEQYANLIVSKQGGVSAFDDAFTVKVIYDRAGRVTGQDIILADYLWDSHSIEVAHVVGVTGIETVDTASHALFAGLKTTLHRELVSGEGSDHDHLNTNVDWHINQFAFENQATVV